MPATRTITRSVEITRTPRLSQLDGLFDLAASPTSEQTWQVDPDLPAEWNVGVIVGPSGAGKSTVAREVFGDALVADWPWPADKSVVDGFPAAMGIKDITGLLSAVGFSSPPAWRKPFRVLSNGQQFRASLARTLAERPGLAVVDEFTSVVDRQVAQVGSAAVGKAVRARGGRFVAVTCHEDVIPWLEPDWVMEIVPGQPVRAKLVRGSVRRPDLTLAVVRTDRTAWERLFHAHHYLSADLHPAAACYAGLIGGAQGRPAVFTAVLPFPHASRPGWREHRTVCVPDFQGVGLGNAFSEFVAGLYVATGRPYFSTTGHPGMIRHRTRSRLWRMSAAPSIRGRHSNRGTVAMRSKGSTARLSASFEYVGPARRDDARRFGLAVAGR